MFLLPLASRAWTPGPPVTHRFSSRGFLGREALPSQGGDARRLAGREGPGPDLGDAGLDLVGGGLGQGRAAAGLAELGVDNAVGLAGAVAPGADQAVEFLAEGGELLAGDRRGGRLRGG